MNYHQSNNDYKSNHNHAYNYDRHNDKGSVTL